MAIGLYTHVDSSRMEDVVDLVTNIDYTSTPFLSSIGEATASNTLHEWQTDSLTAAGDNAGIEGADVSVADIAGPTRVNNVVQMFQKTVTVSDTEMALPHYGIDNPMNYQTTKRLKEMARDMEKALISGTRASGNSGVARRMNGAIALITTNKTARASGTSLSEDEFNAMIAGIFDGGTDSSADLVLTGSYLKRVVDKWTTNVTRNIDASQKRQILSITFYESSFGVHEFRVSREVPTAAGTAAVLAVDTSKWRVAYLTGRRTAATPLAKTGSATKVLIEGEATLEALNEKSSAYRGGYFVG